jgi:hypothetical protein
MAVDKLVDSTQLDADLTDVADEIRTAGGTLLPLSFPDDYVVAIGDIGNTEIKTASGSIAHFEDALARKAQDLTVGIEPVQDLHGYDNPWPGGGGKNKLPYPYFESSKTYNGVTFTVNDDGTVCINGTATARGVFYLQSAGSNFHPDAGTYYVSKGSECQSAVIIVEAYNGTTWEKNLATIGTAGHAQFTVDYDGYDRVSAYISVAIGNSPSNEIVKPMFRLSSVSDNTFAPYSNICPISGWTGANVTRTGKNLFNGHRNDGFISDTGVEGIDGTNAHSDFIPVVAGESYVYSWKSTSSSNVNRRIHGYDKNKNWVLMIDKNQLSGSGSKTFVVPDGVAFIRVQFLLSNISGAETDVQIEEGSTAAAYEPFGQTYSITFPSQAGTVYGGELTINRDGSGTLVVDKVAETIPTVTSLSTSAGGIKYASFTTTHDIIYNNNDIKRVQFENFEACTFETRGNPFSGYLGAENQYLIFFGSDTTVEQANTYVNGSKVVLYLKGRLSDKSVTYQLTASQIKTLLGVNNIWADTGNILSVDYPADTKLYIDGKVAYLEALILEN